MNSANQRTAASLEKLILNDLLSQGKIDKDLHAEATKKLISLEQQADRPSPIEIQQFKETYTSNVKDIMLQICLNEYKCNSWMNASYLQDWRNWILSQNFDYYKFYPNHMYMAFDDNKLVGFASIKKINESTVEIRRIYVLPEYRNCGLGKSLYNKIQKEINALSGVSSIQILVCVQFIEAINFFERRGYHITFLDPKKMEYRMEHKIGASI